MWAHLLQRVFKLLNQQGICPALVQGITLCCDFTAMKDVLWNVIFMLGKDI